VTIFDEMLYILIWASPDLLMCRKYRDMRKLGTKRRNRGPRDG